MSHFLLVALGGAIGAMLRHGVGLVTLRFFGPGYPWGTLSVNVVGSFVMGLFIAWLIRHEGAGAQSLRLFVATGLLGGFTTFSAFSLDVALMWERGQLALAGSYVAASVLLSLAGIFAGLFVMRQLAG